MACVRTPTSTIFSTTTWTSLSASATVSNEVSWVSSSTVVSSTRCEVYATPTATTAASSECISSTVIASTAWTTGQRGGAALPGFFASSSPSPSALTFVLRETHPGIFQTNIPHTISTNVPVLVPQVTPIQTLWSECPDDPNPPPDTDTEPTSTSRSTVITRFTSVITQSGGVVTTTITDSTGTNSPSNNGTVNHKSSSLPAIIGGVVGGIIAVAAIVGLIWWTLRRREQLKDLLDEDEDDDRALHGPKAGDLLLRDGKRGRRSVNLESELKDSRPYQYGVVGHGPSPSVSPIPHSQYSSMGGYSHRRDGSRDALMRSRGPSSAPGSPGHLEAHLPPGQRTSLYSGTPESIMMTPQPLINTHPQPGGDVWTGGQRPPPSIMDSANVYPPGHGGFFQQYGPMEAPHSPTTVSSPSTAFGSQPPPVVPVSHPSVHKPSLEPTLASATQPLPTHQALLAAAGLSNSQVASTSSVTVSPPPGAAGARPYTERRETTDMLSAVMASGDQAASSARTDDVGFGRQRPSEKSPRRETVRSPVIQHQDGGRVPESAAGAPPNANVNDPVEAPPAYSQS